VEEVTPSLEVYLQAVRARGEIMGTVRTAVFTSSLLFATAFVEPASGIGKKEFFDRLQEAMSQIRTFQADVVQESRYSDGVVQRYQGKLALSEDGRIAYDYDLIGEFTDPSLARKDKAENTPASPSTSGESETGVHRASASGSYRAKGELVNHYDPGQNLLVESPEDETLLIQIFRTMLGSGNFDVEKFKEENKITSLEETALEDGASVYRLVASPRKGTDMYKWAHQIGNQEVNLQQELWVEAVTMRPLRAVLLSEKESTSVQLKNSRFNIPLDESLFLLPVTGDQPPSKIRRGTADNPHVPPQEFQGRPLEEIETEDR
jgi:outer membrane lipoprotein-sorting protein